MDISGSMGSGVVAGVPGLTPMLAQAALAMVTYKTEKKFIPMAFQTSFVEMPGIGRAKRLDDVLKYMVEMSYRMGGTDCSLPMQYALQNKLEIDTFIVSTDSETWAGRQHPHEALAEYRRKMGIPAKLIVAGMVANKFTIANPNDAGMLDIVGFDTSCPELITGFSRGDF
jgi:60 kDa SS-A/Ro ribonucleoprotein